MSNNRTPAEVLEVFEHLQEEILWIHLRWNIYTQLFSTSAKRTGLLRDVAETFFFVLHQILLTDVQVSLSKLTDAASTGKYDNLSLAQLQQRLEAVGDPALAKRTRDVLDSLKTKCEPFRKWRDKKLVHFDLSTAMKLDGSSLPRVTSGMIDEPLELVRNFMNCIEGFYNERENFYQLVLTLSDAEPVVGLLADGLRYRELVEQENIPYDDHLKSKWSGA
jgi:hypothetical protein